MQMSVNADDGNMSRRGRPENRASREQAPNRSSVRLMDFSHEPAPCIDLTQPADPSPTTMAILDEPFNPASLEHLPQALLDSSSNESSGRDPFDLRHLMPPGQYVTPKGGAGAPFHSTPSLPILVSQGQSSAPMLSRDGERCLTPDLGPSSMSPLSVRLSSSADSALDPQTATTSPTGGRMPNHDEMIGCGCSDHPRVPPRATYRSSDRPRILPIIENGKRTSYTHYWVIPQPPHPLQNRRVRSPPGHDSPSTAADHMETSLDLGDANNPGYMNLNPSQPAVTRSVSMPPRVRPKERRYVKRSSGDTASTGDHEPASGLELLCATNPAFVDESVSSPEPALPQRSGKPSSAMQNAMMVRVRKAVHGVTDEEAIMILQTHRWDVERAIRILKIEQLFRLGVTPVKNTCIKFLDAAGGDLELASAELLKAFSVNVLPTECPPEGAVGGAQP